MAAAQADPTVTVDVVSRVFAVEQRHVQRLAKEGVIPKAGQGKYPLLACTTAYIKYLRDRQTGLKNETSDYQTERTRLTKAQAELAELEVEERRGSLIPVEAAIEEVEDIFHRCKTKLSALPSDLAPLVAGMDDQGEIQITMADKVNEALNELSHEFGEQARDYLGEDGASERSASEDDPERMG